MAYFKFLFPTLTLKVGLSIKRQASKLGFKQLNALGKYRRVREPALPQRGNLHRRSQQLHLRLHKQVISHQQLTTILTTIY